MPAFWAAGRDCLLCGGTARGEAVCDGCVAALPRMAGDDPIAAFEYRFPIDRLVRHFKYAGDLAAGDWLARQLARRVAPRPRPDILVVPPMDAARLRERGFNQSLEIARVVGRAMRTAVSPAILRRTRAAPPQASLDREARGRNLRNAFECRVRLGGRSVAIVDDVVTTGATMAEMRRALRAAGAGRVEAWAVAHATLPGR